MAVATHDAGVQVLCPGCGQTVLQKAMIPVLAGAGPGFGYLCQSCARALIVAPTVPGSEPTLPNDPQPAPTATPSAPTTTPPAPAAADPGAPPQAPPSAGPGAGPESDPA